MRFFKKKVKIIEEMKTFNVQKLWAKLYFESGQTLTISIAGRAYQNAWSLDPYKIIIERADDVLLRGINEGWQIWKKENNVGIEEIMIGKVLRVKVLKRENFFQTILVKSIK